MISNLTEAEGRADDIVRCILKICEEYGLRIPIIGYIKQSATIYKRSIKVDIVAHNRLNEGIDFYYFKDSSKFYFQCFINEIAEHIDSDEWNYLFIEDDEDPYKVVLKFFKDNDVLTYDEMIIKDIIE